MIFLNQNFLLLISLYFKDLAKCIIQGKKNIKRDVTMVPFFFFKIEKFLLICWEVIAINVL